MKKRVVEIVAVVLGIMLVIGCSKKNNEYEAFMLINDNSNTEFALVTLQGSEVPLLFECDFTYQDGGKNYAIDANIYGCIAGVVENIGYVESDGTAYPISVSEKYIYAAGNHWVAKYELSTDQKKLILVDQALEQYDENANVTYYFNDQIVSDDSYLLGMFEEFGKAKPVDFHCIYDL